MPRDTSFARDEAIYRSFVIRSRTVRDIAELEREYLVTCDILEAAPTVSGSLQVVCVEQQPGVRMTSERNDLARDRELVDDVMTGIEFERDPQAVRGNDLSG